MSTLHVVVGAGGLGRTVAHELVTQGHRVRLVSRSEHSAGPDIESVRADATDPAQLDTALAGADVVYQCSQPEYTRWAEEFPQLQRGILDATVRAGADLVIADNLYMYGDPNGTVINEASPEAPVTKKGRVRKAMADAALEAHHAGMLRVAISRPSNYFGPGHDQSSKAVFGAAVKGKSMRFYGRMDAPHSSTYLPDAARAMATLGTTDQGWGSVWIPPVQPAITQHELASRVWTAAGNAGNPRVSVLSRRELALLGIFIPLLREVDEMYYEYERPFVVDSSKFQGAFGAEPTPMDVAIAATLASYAEARPVR